MMFELGVAHAPSQFVSAARWQGQMYPGTSFLPSHHCRQWHSKLEVEGTAAALQDTKVTLSVSMMIYGTDRDCP